MDHGVAQVAQQRQVLLTLLPGSDAVDYLDPARRSDAARAARPEGRGAGALGDCTDVGIAAKASERVPSERHRASGTERLVSFHDRSMSEAYQ